MTHLRTPNQTPAPCRCVKYNPSPGGVKCGTCGGSMQQATVGETPETLIPSRYIPYLTGEDTDMKPPAIVDALRRALKNDPQPYYRTNADAARNQGGQERGLIG